MTPTEKLLEQVLILQCQLGNEQAFYRLVERHEGSLRYFVNRLRSSADDADDILQDVWLTVFRKIRTLASPQAFTVWLYRIARNRVYQGLRRKKQLVPLDDDPQAPDEAQEEDRFSPDDAARIHAALDTLRPEHKEVLVLRFLEQMAYDEIAKVIDCSLGTVKSRIYYGKRMLRRRIIEEMDDGE